MLLPIVIGAGDSLALEAALVDAARRPIDLASGGWTVTAQATPVGGGTAVDATVVPVADTNRAVATFAPGALTAGDWTVVVTAAATGRRHSSRRSVRVAATP